MIMSQKGIDVHRPLRRQYPGDFVPSLLPPFVFLFWAAHAAWASPRQGRIRQAVLLNGIWGEIRRLWNDGNLSYEECW
jgi:hypothetical protein